MRIPKAVEIAIVSTRSYFHDLNKKAQAFNESSEDPEVQVGFVTKPLELDSELRFWEIPSDEELEDFLFEDLLAALVPLPSGTDWTELPSGYRPLINILEFERHCQFEGWLAVSNEGSDQMRDIIESYKKFGLEEEAAALEAVLKAYEVTDENSEAFYEALGKAYGSVPNDTEELEDRLPLILNYVRAHPKMFAE